jgi:hypothetical protein
MTNDVQISRIRLSEKSIANNFGRYLCFVSSEAYSLLEAISPSPSP